jgi:predicted phage terminase large subunit-like protein
MYMGQPRPRGGAVFGEPQFYIKKPEKFKACLGCDFAYSSRTYADFSVAVALAYDGEYYYVLDVVRRQVEAPAFGGDLRRLQQTFGVPFTAYIGGTEKGVVDLMKAQGVRINTENATADKFTRAQPVAAAWNAGKVLLPMGAPWLNDFMAEFSTFTGVHDKHDDQVDALTGAFLGFTRQAVRGVGSAPLFPF